MQLLFITPFFFQILKNTLIKGTENLTHDGRIVVTKMNFIEYKLIYFNVI